MKSPSKQVPAKVKKPVRKWSGGKAKPSRKQIKKLTEMREKVLF